MSILMVQELGFVISIITYGEGLSGLTTDGGNIGSLTGTYELSNAITINRN